MIVAPFTSFAQYYRTTTTVNNWANTIDSRTTNSYGRTVASSTSNVDYWGNVNTHPDSSSTFTVQCKVSK